VSSLKANDRGFSLLEVIVTIAILSVGIVMVMEAIVFSTGAAALSCDVVSAVFLAEDKLQELEYKEADSLISNEPEEAQGTRDKFSWKRTLKLDPAIGLYALDMELEWKTKSRQESFGVQTYFRK
jgi:prepilin-type N-terminal cleavage/methylation domain-containing protein